MVGVYSYLPGFCPRLVVQHTSIRCAHLALECKLLTGLRLHGSNSRQRIRSQLACHASAGWTKNHPYFDAVWQSRWQTLAVVCYVIIVARVSYDVQEICEPKGCFIVHVGIHIQYDVRHYNRSKMFLLELTVTKRARTMVVCLCICGSASLCGCGFYLGCTRTNIM